MKCQLPIKSTKILKKTRQIILKRRASTTILGMTTLRGANRSALTTGRRRRNSVKISARIVQLRYSLTLFQNSQVTPWMIHRVDFKLRATSFPTNREILRSSSLRTRPSLAKPARKIRRRTWVHPKSSTRRTCLEWRLSYLISSNTKVYRRFPM